MVPTTVVMNRPIRPLRPTRSSVVRARAFPPPDGDVRVLDVLEEVDHEAS